MPSGILSLLLLWTSRESYFCFTTDNININKVKIPRFQWALAQEGRDDGTARRLVSAGRTRSIDCTDYEETRWTVSVCGCKVTR